MVAPKTMTQGINPDDSGHDDHSGFKPEIMYDVNAENGEAR